jgi:uncharacterized lipoprotein YehR (DUF1307 family)
MEDAMNLINIDATQCDRSEKEVVEGVCLSFDMMKGICLETMEKCVAMGDDEE